jgi:hypothetical protein
MKRLSVFEGHGSNLCEPTDRNKLTQFGFLRSIVNTLSVDRVYLRAGFRIEWFRESGGNLRAGVSRDDGLAGSE